MPDMAACSLQGSTAHAVSRPPGNVPQGAREDYHVRVPPRLVSPRLPALHNDSNRVRSRAADACWQRSQHLIYAPRLPPAGATTCPFALQPMPSHTPIGIRVLSSLRCYIRAVAKYRNRSVVIDTTSSQTHRLFADQTPPVSWKRMLRRALSTRSAGPPRLSWKYGPSGLTPMICWRPSVIAGSTQVTSWRLAHSLVWFPADSHTQHPGTRVPRLCRAMASACRLSWNQTVSVVGTWLSCGQHTAQQGQDM